eukprot:GILI01003437.1.p1 GENE.GILI01003437.1~~GILI01003437.1.p1  ORF type:complete len:529 (+),score=114.32 GILI01003437.1:694-2280(+)
MPEIEKRLNDGSWLVRETAILALGAVAEGCYQGVVKFLPHLIPYLLTLCNSDDQPLIRSIGCWTMSRYAHWVALQCEHMLNESRSALARGDHAAAQAAESSVLLGSVLGCFLRCMQDRNKKVQESACSSLATLEEVARENLIPYIPEILKTFHVCFGLYYAKNLTILFDCVCTFVEVVPDEMRKSENLQLLLPPIVEKWNQIDSNDRNCVPLLECMTMLCNNLENALEKLAPSFFARALSLIETTLVAMATAKHCNEQPPEPDHLIASLDLLSAVCTTLGTSVESLVGPSNLLPLLFECMKHNRFDIRQCAFALLGDLSRLCIGHLRPVLHQFVEILVSNLNPVPISVCNNASWCLGEMALASPADMKPFVPTVLPRLIDLLSKASSLHKSLVENTAITLGRFGLIAPELVAPHLPTFAVLWCSAIKGVLSGHEKESAFHGMCLLIQHNPEGILNAFPFLCDAIGTYENPPAHLHSMFTSILHEFRRSLGDGWNHVFIKMIYLPFNTLAGIPQGVFPSPLECLFILSP